MNFTYSDPGNTFNELKVNTKLGCLFDKKNYNLSNVNFLEKLKLFATSIDTISNFSHKGLYYNNALIFAISSNNINLVKKLLEQGAAARGYVNYPGYPLHYAIITINNKILNNNIEKIMTLISIIEILVKYGARFDDYIVHIFWFKYDSMYNSLQNSEQVLIKKLYIKSPFDYNKYKKYIEIYCKNFISNQKNIMLKYFLEKYPIKRNKSFTLRNLFSYK